MTELMEQGNNLIPAQECGLTVGGFGVVTDVVDHRFGVEQRGLVNKVAHPCAAAFTVTLEEIGIKQRHPTAVNIKDFIYLYVWMVNRQIVTRGKLNTIELGRSPKHAIFEHRVEFKIGFDLAFIQIVLCPPHLFCIKIPVPRAEREVALLAVDGLLNGRGFPLRTGSGGGNDITHKGEGSIRGFCHLIL